MALSRPRHYVLFGLFLVALFLVTFRVTQAVYTPPPEAPIQLLVFRSDDAVEFYEPPKPLPDVMVAALTARECATTDPDEPGGLLTILVRNEGPGEAKGFALYAALNVRNVDAGAALDSERSVWIERLGPGEEATIRMPYAFPQRDSVVAGPVSSNEPVPGNYRLEVVLDRPSILPNLGDEGLQPEVDEYNNSAQTRTSGIAEGLC